MTETIAAQLRRELTAMRLRGASRDEIMNEIAEAKIAMDEQSAKDPERKRDVNDTIGAVAQAVLGGATFGIAGLLEDALTKGSFQQNREARGKNIEALPWYASIPAYVAGAVINPVGGVVQAARGVRAGLSAGKALAGASRSAPLLRSAPAAAGMGRVAFQGAKEGALQGAAGQLGENVGREGGIGPLAMRTALGAVFGAPFGAAGGAIGRQREVSKAAGRGFFSRETPAEAAGRRASEAVDADKTYQVPVLPTGVGAPKPIALDVSGPTMQAEARKAAQSVPGRQAIEPIFAAREKQMPFSIEDAFDHATGTTAKDAEMLTKDLAVLEQFKAHANTKQQAEYTALIAKLKDQHAAAVDMARRQSMGGALKVLKSESGGRAPDAVETLGQLKAARSESANVDYPRAIEGTKGQPAPLTDEAKAFLKTPTGQAAWAFAQRSRADVVASDPSRALPEVVKGTRRPRGFAPTQLGPNAALAKPETIVVPDAEAWHVMKRYLADAAKLGPGESTPEGLSSIHAGNALKLHGTALDQQDELFRAADLAYAEKSGEMTATKLGMVQARANPPVQQALSRSLTAIEKRSADLPPNEADLFREGKRFSIASLFRRGLSTKKAADMLEEPSSDLSREIVLAYGEDAPQRIAAQLRAQQVGKLKLPPKPADIALDPEAQATVTGLGVRTTPVAPATSAPERSLGALEDRIPSMSLAEQQTLQRGAAAAERGELASGRALDLTNPERMRQFRIAAESPAKAQAMGQVEQAWKDIAKRQGTILGSESHLAPEPFGLWDIIKQSVSASLPYTGARAVRTVGTHPITKAGAARKGLADASFLKLLGDDPKALSEVIRQIAELGTRSSAAAGRGSATAGRLGGVGASVFPYQP